MGLLDSSIVEEVAESLPNNKYALEEQLYYDDN